MGGQGAGASAGKGKGSGLGKGVASSAGKGAGSVASRLQKRAAWLNSNVFASNPIDDNAIASMAELEYGRAMELFKDVEEKAGEVNNPSGYLKAAVKRDLGEYIEFDMEKVRKRAVWLNSNVFLVKPIDEEAIAAMAGMGAHRAMELFKEIEEKADSVRNPSSWLKNAAAREGFGPPEGKVAASSGHFRGHDADKVRRRGTWLNSNVFIDNPIDEDALAAMEVLDVGSAMELFKDVESKIGEVKNPSGYLQAAVKRAMNGQGTGPAPKRRRV